MTKLDYSHYQNELADFGQRWKVTEVALFGSALRDDSSPDSALEVLVTFNIEARWSHFDLINMQNELEQLFSRKVELVERSALEKSHNAVRRKHILSNTEVIFLE
jgi:hypothetical protein